MPQSFVSQHIDIITAPLDLQDSSRDLGGSQDIQGLRVAHLQKRSLAVTSEYIRISDQQSVSFQIEIVRHSLCQRCLRKLPFVQIVARQLPLGQKQERPSVDLKETRRILIRQFQYALALTGFNIQLHQTDLELVIKRHAVDLSAG